MGFNPFIYGLVDPADPGHVRYVGMAGVRASRPYQHAKWARKPSVKPCHLLHWVRKLQAEGREYSVLVLEELAEGTSRQFLGEVEKMYIAALRNIGHRLTNESNGGLGGAILSVEANARRAAKQIGNKRGAGVVHSEASRHQVSESRKRYFMEHPEARIEISIRNLGNAHSLGYRHTESAKHAIGEASVGNAYDARITDAGRQRKREFMTGNASRTGMKNSLESNARRSRSGKRVAARRKAEGFVRSVEHNAKLGESVKARWAAIKADPIEFARLRTVRKLAQAKRRAREVSERNLHETQQAQ